jgi:glycerophosphoryl diester phosphodiesterase
LAEKERFASSAPAVGPGISVLRRDQTLVERIHKQGREVHVWTVDEPDDIALCIRLGVDAIITNKPAEVVAAIGD